MQKKKADDVQSILLDSRNPGGADWRVSNWILGGDIYDILLERR